MLLYEKQNNDIFVHWKVRISQTPCLRKENILDFCKVGSVFPSSLLLESNTTTHMHKKMTAKTTCTWERLTNRSIQAKVTLNWTHQLSSNIKNSLLNQCFTTQPTFISLDSLFIGLSTSQKFGSRFHTVSQW